MEDKRMKDNIYDAIKLLKENGYVIKKFTEVMKNDAKECELSGCQKDCDGCSCNMCIIQ
jgi:hypothetical protein